MNSYKLRMSDEIARLIRGLHPHLKRKIKGALKRIISNPSEGKSLKAELKGLNSYKVSRFRIIYRIAGEDCIELVAIGPRKIIYEETFYLIQKE
ncbi:MAG: type II toxin-antitoxin system RelE family toxin [bacterium]